MNSNTRIQKSFHEIGLDFFLLHSELAKGKLHFYAKWKIIPLFAIQDTLFFNTSSDPILTYKKCNFDNFYDCVYFLQRMTQTNFRLFLVPLQRFIKNNAIKKLVKLSRIILKYQNHTFIIVLK